MIMANYTTSCSANGGILNGSMQLDLSTGNATSYTNNNGVTVVPDNIGASSSNINFNLNFANDPKTYHINARPDANGHSFSGSGGAPGPGADVDPWTATAVEPLPKSAEDSESAS
jgi:hypothetical protein